ncbi:helix-turn-helix transcriptional regulator [Leekyejoonella antrihumi]|uniref:helix-turn-helix transcriptional regulator n=1 Tax=Leekyejoonella antrihumi TaxID=1660198 RepID=UPI0016477E50|nr:helix-turn-helix transcriptional regulator [Leekyejoonella antrihumi]
MPALPSPSHPFIGRAEVLEALITRAVSGDSPSITLVGGDAGVGKTRLLAEVMLRANAAGRVVALGHCLDLGESSAPYLPVSEILRRLVQEGSAEADNVRATWPLLAPLLPSGPRSGPVDDTATMQDPSAFFASVHSYLEHIADSERLLVVIEDAHWADRSTRELLTYLFTIGFRGPVSLIASYRSDDLFRKHPLRRNLAEWTRLPAVHRIALGPLTDTEVTNLLQTLAPDLGSLHIDRIIARSGGNPFFAEELLAVAGLDQTGIPDELADLLLLRIDSLDENARTVVRAASAAGQFISHDLLRRVVDLSDTELDQALRSIIEHHIFHTTSSGGYAFRHALLAEAVADDLLPGERVRLHRRYAEAWQQSSHTGAAAALAGHARAAGMSDLALRASIAAGDEAMASSGPADAAQHYENALALLAEAPTTDAAISPVTLALRAGSALMTAGDPHRAAEVLRAAYSESSDDIFERAKLAARILEAELIADVRDLSLSAVDRSIRDLEKHSPDMTLAFLHAVRARALLSERALDQSALAATEALRLARELELPRVVANATTTLALLDDFAGDADASRASLSEVVEQARATGDVAAEVRALHQLATVLARADKPGEAARVMAEAVDRAVAQHFPTGPFAFDARILSAYYSILTGEWDQADRLLEVGPLRISELLSALVRSCRATLLHHRGGSAVALTEAQALQPMWTRDMFIAVHTGSICILVHGERGDLSAMLRSYDELVSALQASLQLNAFDAQIRLSAEIIGFLATAVLARQARPADYTARVADLMGDVERVIALRSSSRSLGLESQAWLCRARAEHARFEWHGTASPPTEALNCTQEAVQIFDTLGLRYDAARTRARLAELLAASGHRSRAREVAAAALAEARSLGARGLVAALTSHPRGNGSGDTTQLTPRERDVLALLVEGRTNGQIAAKLYISTKTASVHVSNILGKLGASTRTEAAAIAAQRGLL